MKKLLTVVCTMLLAGTLAFAQAGGGTTDTKTPTKTETGKKGKKASKSHKGGKKSKKGQGTDTTTPPPK